MTRLLVSVRDADEALAALDGGVDLIDIKEPSRGALGAADPQIWRQVCNVVAGRAPVSAALGELLACQAYCDVSGLRWVKAGLAGCADDAQWRFKLAQLHASLPPTTELVAVIYADARRAAAPTPMDVLNVAADLRLTTLLIDTFDKSQGNLWSALDATRLHHLVERAGELGIRVALAGSIGLAAIPRALELCPAWLAVRGAACEGSRTGKVSADRVRGLQQAISQGKTTKRSSPVEIGTRL